MRSLLLASSLIACLGIAFLGAGNSAVAQGVPVARDAPGSLYGAGVAIYADRSRGPIYGHGGWIPAYVSSLRHYAGHGVTVAFRINTDAGSMDDSTDLVPAMEAALADHARAAVR